MGQAKKRGTYEQRLAEAIERERVQKIKREEELAALRERQRAFDEANPERALERRKRNHMSALMLSSAVSMAAMGGIVTYKAKG